MSTKKIIADSKKRIVRNTSFLLVGKVLGKICLLLFFAIAARHIGVSGFGKYTFAISFTALFIIFGDIGLKTIAIREVAKNKSLAKKYLGNLIALKLILSTTAVGLIFLSINLLNYPPDTTKIVYIIGISVFFTSLSNALRWCFQAFQEMKYEAMIDVINGVLKLGIGVGIIWLGGGLISLSLAYLFTHITILGFSFLITIKKFTKPKIEVDWTLWKFLIPAAIPIGLTTIFSTIYLNIDTIMLSLMKGDIPVGWYNSSYKLVKTIKIIPAMFYMAVFPSMSGFYKNSIDSLKIIFRKSMQYMFILALPMAIGTTILSYKIVPLIWGKEFIPSIPTLQILIWAGGLAFLSGMAGWCLYATEKQKTPMYLTAIATVINIILNLALIPYFSHIGAAIGILTAELFVTSFAFLAVFKFLKINPFPYHTIKIIISSLIMGGITWLIRELNVILVIFLSATIYFYLLFSFKVLKLKEFKQLVKYKI